VVEELRTCHGSAEEEGEYYDANMPAPSREKRAPLFFCLTSTSRDPFQPLASLYGMLAACFNPVERAVSADFPSGRSRSIDYSLYHAQSERDRTVLQDRSRQFERRRPSPARPSHSATY